MLKLDFAPKIYYLLTVTGRKTGNPHSVPIVLVEEEQKRWLVAPYGEVDWVKNARASEKVKLSRGKWSEDFAIRVLTPEESVPVLKKYLVKFPITKPYFDSQVGSSMNEFVEEARSRPVFELIQIDPKRDESLLIDGA
jgi:deazaflavin-dependent oxidoreductase (nitroreductase family)